MLFFCGILWENEGKCGDLSHFLPKNHQKHPPKLKKLPYYKSIFTNKQNPNNMNSSYNNQQQAVILKGIAQQILQMNVPSFEQAKKLFSEFGIDFDGDETYSRMYLALRVAISIDKEGKDFIKQEFGLEWNYDIVHRIAHYAMKMDKLDETSLMELVFTKKD